MAKGISFASFNLYNFQYKGEKVRGRLVKASEYHAKVAWVQQQLINIDAHVVGLQELWDKRCLEDVLAHPDLADYKPIYISDSWYDIAVAAIVKTPWKVKRKKVIKEFPFQQLVKLDDNDGLDDEVTVNIKRFSRSILKLTLEYPDHNPTPDIVVFCAHFKAKLPTTVRSGVPRAHRSAVGSAISTIRRTAEAVALRWHLNNQMTGSNAKPVVVLGDLNDDPRSNTIAILTDEPNLSSTAKGTDKGLYSTLLLQQLKSFRDVYYTHEFKNRRDAIDHILVSEEFFEHSKRSKWKLKDARIWNDHIHLEGHNASDHGIIRAIFS